MQQNVGDTNPTLATPTLGTKRPKAAPRSVNQAREAEANKVIADIEDEMRRLVDILVDQTNQ